MVIKALRMCVANVENFTALDTMVEASMVFALVVGQDEATPTVVGSRLKFGMSFSLMVGSTRLKR